MNHICSSMTLTKCNASGVKKYHPLALNNSKKSYSSMSKHVMKLKSFDRKQNDGSKITIYNHSERLLTIDTIAPKHK